MKFPIFKTEIKDVSCSFDLADPKHCEEYFRLKARKEIEKLRDYLKENTFIAYFLGKKCSGKGTYSKLFIETVAPDRASHVSIGDIVRDAHQAISDENKKRELTDWLSENYRVIFPLKKPFRSFLIEAPRPFYQLNLSWL